MNEAGRGRPVMTDAILISANPSMVDVDDAMRHLEEHAQLYWSVGFFLDLYTDPQEGVINLGPIFCRVIVDAPDPLDRVPKRQLSNFS